MANPVPGRGKVTEAEFIDPVKKGTKVILEACREFKVERLVVTSSVAALSGSLFKKEENAVYGPEDRNPPDFGTIYERSKAAQLGIIDDFLSRQVPDETGYMLKVLCVCPSLVIGSVLMHVPGSSTIVVQRILDGSIPMLPNLCIAWVNIKDVSEAHIKCLVDRSLDSDVFVLSQEKPLPFIQYANLLRPEFEPLGYKIPKRVAYNWLIKLASIFDSDMA